ncbi:hypothetical protein BXO559_20295, partial [Xanthomonas oryzae pv. oryzae]
DIAPLAAIGCITAYLFSGHTGIYHAQRIGHGKHDRHSAGLEDTLRLADLQARRRLIRRTPDNAASEKRT